MHLSEAFDYETAATVPTSGNDQFWTLQPDESLLTAALHLSCRAGYI